MPSTGKKIAIGAEQDDYRTSDPEEQKFIESHPFFKGRVVGKIVDSIPEDEAPKKPAAPKPKIATPIAPAIPESGDVPKVPTGDEVSTGTGDNTETPGGSDTDGEKIDETPGGGDTPGTGDGGDAEGGEAPKDIEYPEVVDINGAKDVLKAEPYKVHHWALTTPERIRAQATIHGVLFPNWK